MAAKTDSCRGRLWVSKNKIFSVWYLTHASYVGNTMATFVMQALGCEVSALNTVHFSRPQVLFMGCLGLCYYDRQSHRIQTSERHQSHRARDPGYLSRAPAKQSDRLRFLAFGVRAWSRSSQRNRIHSQGPQVQIREPLLGSDMSVLSSHLL